MEFNLKQLQNLYEREENITHAARAYCEENGLVYTDSVRRQASKKLAKLCTTSEVGIIEKPKHTAKILLYDLETSHIIARMFSLWQNGVNPDDVIKDWSLLCFSAKWLFDDEVMSFKMTEEELKTWDDRRIVKELWDLMDEANFVIAHNAAKFDNRKSNAKFLQYDLKLPSPYQTIDTLQHAKKKFAMTSNRLSYIAEYLGLESKMETSKGLWNKVEDGDYEALLEMDRYCIQDVKVLEEVYLKLRPYIQHPNLGLFIEDNVHSCPSCGSTHITWNSENVYATTSNIYSSFRCNDCGSIGRSKSGLLKAKDTSNLTVPNAR